MNKVVIALVEPWENQEASDSDVTSCSIEVPSTTPFLPVAYLE
jgi:hypothetical protein